MKRLKTIGYAILSVAAVVALTRCVGNSTYADASKPHHTANGFRNTYPHDEIGAGFLRWRFERTLAGVPKPPAGGYDAIPRVKPDADRLRSNTSQPLITWIGHATLLLQLDGRNVLTDPHFTERASPVEIAGPARHVPPALNIEQLPHIHVVVISHNHYDHLDRPSVKALATQKGGSPLFLVPLGLRRWFEAEGITRVVEMDWWEKNEDAGLTIHAVPVQHWSARWLFRRNDTLWAGWVIEGQGLRFMFAGDTGYSRDFADIAARLGPIDLAALPIGAYEPRWFMGPQHIGPEEAIWVHRDLKARRSIPMHWGTFEMSDEALDEPPKALARARDAAGVAEADFPILATGQTMDLTSLLRR